MKRILFILFICFVLSPSYVSAETLSEKDIGRLRGIAGIFAREIISRARGVQTPLGEEKTNVDCTVCHIDMKTDIKTVAVEEFKDIEGRPTKEGKEVADEFMRQLSLSGGSNLNIVTVREGADIVISGTLIPFKGREKWRLNIKAVSLDTGRVITVYEGLLRAKK